MGDLAVIRKATSGVGAVGFLGVCGFSQCMKDGPVSQQDSFIFLAESGLYSNICGVVLRRDIDPLARACARCDGGNSGGNVSWYGFFGGSILDPCEYILAICI